MEWLLKGPPWWYGPSYWALTSLTALCLALTAMLQWFLWLVVTGNLGLGAWGMLIGGAIVVAQICVMFIPRPGPGDSCPVPPRGH